MKVITNPFFDDPMYNKSFSELGFEYEKNGTVLTPWINQFPDPIDLDDEIYKTNLPGS